ncbi:tripartite tricarboxylate transporter TctB family protein [Ornithinimicrobium cavernae]|uniref:tripartite tricarboxylate transporter TctB family protein n=1 Tax=Ornithinimicrobium cavernae TaxID=2666047 RepID=UPI000D69E616|nr:tripartite tricarboxylate transporter TctB family protein [Ornithinimicrobium cavernae]
MTPVSQQTEQEAPARSGRSDVIAGLLVTGVGALLLVTALGIGEPVRPAPGIGPATLPLFLSGMLVLSGLVLTGLGLRRRPVAGFEADLLGAGDAEALEELLHEEQPVPWRPLLVHIGLFVGYALIFIPLGYMLSTALYLGATVSVIDRARWKRNLTFAVLFAVIVYFAFTELLMVQLPAGILG